jgi:hypothetical protein
VAAAQAYTWSCQSGTRHAARWHAWQAESTCLHCSGAILLGYSRGLYIRPLNIPDLSFQHMVFLRWNYEQIELLFYQRLPTGTNSLEYFCGHYGFPGLSAGIVGAHSMHVSAWWQIRPTLDIRCRRSCMCCTGLRPYCIPIRWSATVARHFSFADTLAPTPAASRHSARSAAAAPV